MKAYQYLKNAVSLVTAIAKAKSTAVKSKTSAIKTRLLIFVFLRDKKFSINHVVLMGKDNGKDRFGQTKDTKHCNSIGNEVWTCQTSCNAPALHGDSDNENPDIKGSFFHSEDEESEYELGGIESVIDLIRSSQVDRISELRLEDNIDNFADIFIGRFYRQLWMQNQNSLKKPDQDMVFTGTRDTSSG